MSMEDGAWKTASDGRWPEILQSLGGLSPDQLENRHQPCPACGGADRYRWDNDEGAGGWYCNKCGGRDGQGGGGNGMDLLMRVTGWQFRDAATAVERHLGLSEPALVAMGRARANRKPYRRPDKPPIDARPPDRRGAVFHWCYRNAAGEPLFWIQRINLRDGKKLFIHRTWLDDRWHRPSKNDEFTCEWPTPRPIYGLDRLAAAPDAVVLLAEGEKSADAAHGAGDGFVGISWPNGSKAIHKIDWSPLQGRQVVILRDNDDDGLVCTRGLIRLLRGIAASVAVVDPPAGAPPKWDVADPWPQGEGRTVAEWLAGAVDGDAWLGTEAGEVEAKDGARGAGAEPPAGGDRFASRQERLDRVPIVCLGFNGDDYFYQSGDSGQVTRITKQAHSSSTSLIGLADLGIWEQVYPRYNGEGEVIGVSWKDAVNELFRKQHRVGIFDPSRIRGVGAWIDEGKPVFHLGDRLLIAGEDYSVFEPPPSRYLYQRLPRRIGPGDATPLTDIEGERLIGIADRFHWEEPVSGMLLAGWIALAPICGALDWRPHVWLQAIAGSGKTTVLNRFVSPLLSDLKLKVLGATTEAGIRQRLRCDAIPVIFDESESNLKKDVERIQSVLALARIASSESDGVTLKGSAMGESMQFNIRSMFLLSSIATALRQGADESRFCVLTLRIPDTLSAEDKDQRWRELEADLIATVTDEVGRRLAARMITLIPVVREATQTFARHVALELGSARVGDQVGALLAGAWALWNRRPPTDAEAADYIAAAEWGTQRIQAMEGGGDQRRCLDIILQKRLRVDVEHGSLSLTVAELIEIAGGPSSPLDPVSKDAAEAELGRNGIRVTESNTLLIANRASGIAAMLRDTPWSDFGWANLLGSLPGAEKNKQSRYKGLGKTSVRSVELPISLLQ